MYKKKILFIVSTLLISLVGFGFNGNVEAASKFKDVPSTHWASKDTSWAVDKKLIYGYKDGNFKPNNSLTESQFSAVMSRYFNPAIETGVNSNNWSLKHYDYLKKNGIVLPGHNDVTKKNKSVSRIVLARALYNSQGLNGTDKQVIDWMYANGLTKGKGVNKDKYVDFGSNDQLKRVHIVAFFKRSNDKKFTTIKKYKVPVTVPVVNPPVVNPPVVDPPVVEPPVVNTPVVKPILYGNALLNKLETDIQDMGGKFIISSSDVGNVYFEKDHNFSMRIVTSSNGLDIYADNKTDNLSYEVIEHVLLTHGLVGEKGDISPKIIQAVNSGGDNPLKFIDITEKVVVMVMVNTDSIVVSVLNKK
jgi:hypothetical protein